MATTNAERWLRAKFARSTRINAEAAKIEANRGRYEVVSKATGVPWDVIHYRGGFCRFLMGEACDMKVGRHVI